MDLIIGSTSRVAQRYVAHRSERDFVATGRDDLSRWIEDGEDALKRYLEALDELPEVVHLFAGVTDPRAPHDEIWAVNVELPLTVMSAAKAFGLAVNTYGTALEELGPSENLYIESKRFLATEVAKVRAAGVDAMHIRFHTVYGASIPQPHMFLGQMLQALLAEEKFQMSSGTQFREYHHVDDLVRAIAFLSDTRPHDTVTISHGHAVQLRDIAIEVFESFGQGRLLELGAIATPAAEVMAPFEGQTTEVGGLEFRDPIPGVVQYMHEAFQIARLSQR